MADEPVLLTDTLDRVATLTLHRPERRNALNGALVRAIGQAVTSAEADDGVDVIILTGSDPAFCAGVDLKELGSGRMELGGVVADPTTGRRGPLPPHTKPVIGAINGPAVTGGLELVLNCDFLVASSRAAFADTHARVGVMPGWGLTVLLPEAIGVRRAREMSVTGNYVDAQLALEWGLVNHVVEHDDLLPFCRRLAADIVSNDQGGVRQMLDTYERGLGVTADAAWQLESEVSRRWLRERHDPARVEERRQAIIDRGRDQQDS